MSAHEWRSLVIRPPSFQTNGICLLVQSASQLAVSSNTSHIDAGFTPLRRITPRQDLRRGHLGLVRLHGLRSKTLRQDESPVVVHRDDGGNTVSRIHCGDRLHHVEPGPTVWLGSTGPCGPVPAGPDGREERR